MSAGVWLFGGLALLAWPPRRPPRAHPGPRERSERSRGLSPAWAAAIAVCSVGVVLVGVLGFTLGGVAAFAGAPVVAKGVARLARGPTAIPVGRELALTLDLVAAALRGGRPLAASLELATRDDDTAAAQGLRRVAGLLRLGAPPEVAWAVVAENPLRQVAASAVRSASSGIRLAGGFERLATELRAGATALAAARAHRAGVLSMAPLAACFLPSFVCLGVVPVVVGMLRTTGLGP